jgi:hypothetical protein
VWVVIPTKSGDVKSKKQLEPKMPAVAKVNMLSKPHGHAAEV